MSWRLPNTQSRFLSLLGTSGLLCNGETMVPSGSTGQVNPGPLGTLRRGLGKGERLLPWCLWQSSKRTLSCVCGSRVSEELPLPGGPRGADTNPHTLTSRATLPPHRFRWPVCVLTPLNVSPDNWNRTHRPGGAIKSTRNGSSAYLFCNVNDWTFNQKMNKSETTD